jgi:transketolase C-terminal domain/subunit
MIEQEMPMEGIGGAGENNKDIIVLDADLSGSTDQLYSQSF